jgi:hypothetical protein
MQTRPGAGSLDQIEYRLGHTSGNLRWVHFQCNAFRGDWGDEALYKAAKAIAAAYERRRAPSTHMAGAAFGAHAERGGA